MGFLWDYLSLTPNFGSLVRVRLRFLWGSYGIICLQCPILDLFWGFYWASCGILRILFSVLDLLWGFYWDSYRILMGFLWDCLSSTLNLGSLPGV